MSDHLLPEASPFHHWEIDGSYNLSVARRLLQKSECHPVIATAVCLPSFEPEWAIRIHGSEELGFAATLTRAQTPIWSAGHNADVNVSQNVITLSSSLAHELLKIWVKMLRDAKYQTSASAGLDGVSYHFLYFKNTHGHLCGQTWSPDPESTAGHFVSLAHCLHDFVMVDSITRPGIESKLKSEVEWFRDIPIRPPLRENATITLEKKIKKVLDNYQRGFFTDTDAARQVAYAFNQVRYPTFRELLGIIDLIPEPIRKLICERIDD